MAIDRPRPFLDTNVLFSALHSPSKPAEIVRLHVRRRINIVISTFVLEELTRTIARKRPERRDDLHRLLTLRPPEIWPNPTSNRLIEASTMIHEKDAPVLAAAIMSGADCLVSGNTKHFTPAVATEAGLAIFTPAEYLDHLIQRGLSIDP
jgi:predicted nucleic acid-binding protein